MIVSLPGMTYTFVLDPNKWSECSIDIVKEWRGYWLGDWTMALSTLYKRNTILCQLNLQIHCRPDSSRDICRPIQITNKNATPIKMFLQKPSRAKPIIPNDWHLRFRKEMGNWEYKKKGCHAEHLLIDIVSTLSFQRCSHDTYEFYLRKLSRWFKAFIKCSCQIYITNTLSFVGGYSILICVLEAIGVKLLFGEVLF